MNGPGGRVGWRRLAPLGVMVVLASGCGPAPGAGADPPRRHVVEIHGMEFLPATLEVAPGDTVVWINRDIVPHTATATGADGWDTGEIARDREALHVPERPGSVSYECALHPTMRGTLVVRDRTPAPER